MVRPIGLMGSGVGRLGKTVAAECLRRGIAAEALAAELGVSRRTLYRILSGERPGAITRGKLEQKRPAWKRSLYYDTKQCHG